MCQLKYHCIDHNEKTEKAFSTINDKIIIININLVVNINY